VTRVQRLEEDEERPAVLGGELLLELGQPLDLLLEQLPVTR
jgi:hypothetical protein